MYLYLTDKTIKILAQGHTARSSRARYNARPTVLQYMLYCFI